MSNEKYSAGSKIFADVHGKDSAKNIMNTLETWSPQLAQYSVEWIFADIYADNTLDTKTRELLNLAALTVSGNCLPQIKNHTKAAFKAGATIKEVKACVLQMLIICGFPGVVNAMQVIQEVEDEISS